MVVAMLLNSEPIYESLILQGSGLIYSPRKT